MVMSSSGREFRTAGMRLFWKSPDRLVAAKGSGCTVVVGLALFAAGVFCVLGGTTSMWGWPPGVTIPGVKWPMAMFVLGTLLVVAGLGNATHRARTVFDTSRGTWVQQGSVFFVIGLNKWGLIGDLEAVHVAESTGTAGQGDLRCYEALLKGRTGRGDDISLELGTWWERENAEELADAVSKFLNLPVVGKA